MGNLKPNQNTRAKVFGIGFHKTGTSSLAAALDACGYRVTGPNGVHNLRIAKEVYEMAYRLVPQYDAFQDNPWPVLYRELDERFPGSRFVLTIRPTALWIRSVVRHFGTSWTPMRAWIYGVGYPAGNEDIYIRRYEEHNREVMNYFSGRSDFLIMRITEGDGWQKLCSFLNHQVPNEPFPHVNKADERERSHR